MTQKFLIIMFVLCITSCSSKWMDNFISSDYKKIFSQYKSFEFYASIGIDPSTKVDFINELILISITEGNRDSRDVMMAVDSIMKEAENKKVDLKVN